MRKRGGSSARDRIPASASLGAPPAERVMRAALRQRTPGLSPATLGAAYADWLGRLARSPEKLSALAASALSDAVGFGLYAGKASLARKTPAYIEPPAHDRRFTGERWQRWPFNLIHQSFLLSERWWQQATTGVPGASKHHQDVVAFTARQILELFSPSNFPLTNPEILAATAAQRGANLWRGAGNLLEDWQRLAAGERPVGADAYRPGKAVALTPGTIVYRNALIELIQYAPATRTVHAEPLLLVPAWILKYYILDLSPGNSLVRYLVERGHNVFVISWKNPAKADHALGFDDYRKLGVLAAVNAIAAIVPGKGIHAVGYCLGGTLLALTAAAMARDGDRRLRTMTLLAAQVDFTEAGELSTFIDEAQIASLESLMAAQGYLDSRQLVLSVLLLRASEFLWPFLVRQYLLGEREPMTDLMAWRTDATRLPYRMFSQYLRHFFFGNDLAEGRYRVDGRPVRIGDLAVPIFAVGALGDFVAPWRSVYRIGSLTDTELTFVLADGDHHTGIIVDPGQPERSFEIAVKGKGEPAPDADEWRKTAARRAGSWWPEWQAWLARHSGKRVKARPPGNPSTGYPPLADAPGEYVLQD